MAVTNIFGRDFYQGTDAEMATCTPRVTGALFWTTDTLKLYCYSGGAWNEVGVGAGGGVSGDSIWDAKGDLAVGTGADTASRLAVGTDGKMLYADSGTATGLKWDTAPSASVATDPIWDAKGDLAVGTGANTASKLTVGGDDTYLIADNGEATGARWSALLDHDHSGDAGDGGTFDAANLTSGASTDGQVLTSDGAGGAAWEDAAAGGGSVATDTIWDAKGDLAVGTGANTASKLSVGANGLYLFADSGEATGIKWKSPTLNDWNTKSGSISSSAYAFKGNYYEPSRNMILHAIAFYGTAVASAVYKAMVITVAGGVIASVLGTSESVTMNASMADLTLHVIWMRFLTPVYLTAETKYGFIYGRTDDADNYALPCPFSVTASAPFDSEDGNNESIRIAENDPIVGTSVNNYTDNPAMGFQWTYV